MNNKRLFKQDGIAEIIQPNSILHSAV